MKSDNNTSRSHIFMVVVLFVGTALNFLFFVGTCNDDKNLVGEVMYLDDDKKSVDDVVRLDGDTLAFKNDMCAHITNNDPDMVCVPLAGMPATTFAVTYDPKTEWIAKSRDSQGNMNYVLDLATIVKNNVPHNQLVLDVGCNVGLFSMSALGLGHRVVAFEPGLENRKRIEAATFVNGFTSRMTLVPYALGADLGHFQLFLNPDSKVYKSDGIVVSGPDDPMFKTLNKNIHANSGATGDRWTLEHILVVSLDRYNNRNQLKDVYAVKIDVEGFESLFVTGAKKFFTDVHPKILMMELNGLLWHSRAGMPGYMDIPDTLRFFEKVGYEIYDQPCIYQGKSNCPVRTALYFEKLIEVEKSKKNVELRWDIVLKYNET